MKRLVVVLFLGCCWYGAADASQTSMYQYRYYTPALYGNALSGFFGDCFPVGGASTPFFSRLYAPPVWGSQFGSASYNLDQVFGSNSWINSGLSQFYQKGHPGTAVSDAHLTPQNYAKYPFLLAGGAEWEVNAPKIVSYIQNNEGSQSFMYYNAALIEYFSARLAMATSAFMTASATDNANNGFLNMQYPSSLQYTYNEQAILNNFVTAAQNLFSWARYLRNISVPDSMNLPSVASMASQTPTTMTQANGYTLGGLDTFVGAIVISPEAAPSMTPPLPASTDANGNPIPAQPNGVSVGSEIYGLQQVVYPVFQKPSEPSQVPASTSSTSQGLLVNMATPITVNAPTQNMNDRFEFPGYTSFGKRITQGNNLYFLPVSTQVYNTSTNGTPAYYAVQETADNWATASTSTCNATSTCNPGAVYFRQVAFRPTTNGGLSGGVVIVGVGVTNAPNSTAAVPCPTTISVGQVAAYDQNSAAAPTAGYPIQIDTSSAFTTAGFNYSDPNFANFFADRQPWAVVVEMVPTFVSPTGTTNGQPNPVVSGFPNGFYQLNPTIVAVVKLNSFDFPLMFAQDPLAQGYTGYLSSQNAQQGQGLLSTQATSSQNSTTWMGAQPEISNPLLPAAGQGNVGIGNSVGIAFSQRTVWEGVENLYALVLQKTTYPPYPTYNYSFAYLFLQALFNGHLYSATANSLYGAMKSNGHIKGRTQSTVRESGVIGNLTYDYMSETNLPLYKITNSLPLSANSAPAYGVWPVNEPRIEPSFSDWLNPGTPLDWIFLRALMVGRALVENVGITIDALSYLETILAAPNTSFDITRRGYVKASARSKTLPVYIGQKNGYQTVLTVPSSATNLSD